MLLPLKGLTMASAHIALASIQDWERWLLGAWPCAQIRHLYQRRGEWILEREAAVCAPTFVCMPTTMSQPFLSLSSEQSVSG